MGKSSGGGGRGGGQRGFAIAGRSGYLERGAGGRIRYSSSNPLVFRTRTEAKQYLAALRKYSGAAGLGKLYVADYKR